MIKEIEKHKRLIYWILDRDFRWLAKTHLREDLYQQGMIGLVKAIRSFDKSKGMKFSPYAVWWIKMYIRQGIRLYGKDTKVKKTKDAEVLLTEEQWTYLDRAPSRKYRRKVDFLLMMAEDIMPMENIELLKDAYGIDRPKLSLSRLAKGYGCTAKRLKNKIKAICYEIRHMPIRKYSDIAQEKITKYVKRKRR